MLDVFHSDPVKVKANGIEIFYDTFGESTAPAMLLVQGWGAHMVGWDENFCSELASHGYWVIRFDNRDVGLSTHLDHLGTPDIPAMVQTYRAGEKVLSPYSLEDMADDAVGLLDALGIERSHVVGASMGGTIVQEMVIHHPERVLTMTSISSSTGNPTLPRPNQEKMAILASLNLESKAESREDYIENNVKVSMVLNGPGFPLYIDYARSVAELTYNRGLNPAGTTRQLAASLSSGSRKDKLSSVKIPTLVIHGDADPAVPLEAGIDTAEAIAGSKLIIIEGLGHYFPPSVWQQLIDAIVEHTK